MTSGNRVVVYLDATPEEIKKKGLRNLFFKTLREALGNTKTNCVFICRAGGWHWEDLEPESKSERKEVNMPWTTEVVRVIATPAGSYQVPTTITDLSEAVKAAARSAGLTHFRVFVGGDELAENDPVPSLDEALADGIRIERYDKAG